MLCLCFDFFFLILLGVRYRTVLFFFNIVEGGSVAVQYLSYVPVPHLFLPLGLLDCYFSKNIFLKNAQQKRSQIKLNFLRSKTTSDSTVRSYISVRTIFSIHMLVRTTYVWYRGFFF